MDRARYKQTGGTGYALKALKQERGLAITATEPGQSLGLPCFREPMDPVKSCRIKEINLPPGVKPALSCHN